MGLLPIVRFRTVFREVEQSTKFIENWIGRCQQFVNESAGRSGEFKLIQAGRESNAKVADVDILIAIRERNGLAMVATVPDFEHCVRLEIRWDRLATGTVAVFDEVYTESLHAFTSDFRTLVRASPFDGIRLSGDKQYWRPAAMYLDELASITSACRDEKMLDFYDTCAVTREVHELIVEALTETDWPSVDICVLQSARDKRQQMEAIDSHIARSRTDARIRSLIKQLRL